MTNVQIDASIAKNADGSVAVEATREALMEAGAALVKKATELGLAGDVAAMYRHDPLTAENQFRDMLFGVARTILADAFTALDDHGKTVKVEGKTYRKAAPTSGRAMTVFGPVDFLRSRYRPAGTGASLIPTEALLRLMPGRLTPAAAGLSLYLMSNLTARESEDMWEKLCGQGPSVASLVRLSGDAGTCMEACSDDVLDGLREEEELPEEATSILVSLDGVMMRMHAETTEEPATDAGWREASSGVVALVDGSGNLLESRYFGRLPETGKTSLKAQLTAEVRHWQSVNPDLKLVAVADGAKDNWTFLEALDPEVMLLDFWHVTQHLQAAADAAFGPNTAAGTVWFEKWRHWLRHDPKGASKAIDALRYLMRKGKGAAVIRRELNFFRNHRHRMHYADAAVAGFPIGSGAVEAANKVLVTTRMKRSGQRWGRDGGQGVLSFRSLLKSGRFDRAWAALVPRLGRGGGWKLPPCANENRQVVQVALVA